MMDAIKSECGSELIEKQKLLNNCLSSQVMISVPSRRSSGTTSNDSSEILLNSITNSVELVWYNVRYVIHNKWNKFSKKNVNQFEVLKNVSGKCESGKLSVFLGPSGAGKTSLLECIAGRRSIGLQGEVYVTGLKKPRIAFCAQRDDHLQELTVKETLIFASRLKNYNKKSQPKKKWDMKAHVAVVEKILDQLGLECCANVRVSGCSGGQKKRLTIAIELVTRPNVLVLDEPTSGLDSSSCLQCVRLLQKLARGNETQPMVIIASLHQPSIQVLDHVDKLYILSKNGRCIYTGPPAELTDFCAKFGLSCPIYQTPTDFAIQVASGDYGIEVVEKMAFFQIESFGYYHEMPSESVTVEKIMRRIKRRSYPFFLHTWLLLARTNITTWRQPQLTTLRLFTSISIALMISLIYKNKIGAASGCVEKSMENFNFMNPAGDTTANIGFIFFSLLFITLSCQMPTILTFPLEMAVFLKERANGWYSCATYYLAKSLSDIPFQVIFPVVYCGISYFATYQLLEIWRISNFFAVNIILAIISQTVGLLIGAIFTDDLTSAVYAVALVTAPLILFTGFLVRFSEMPSYLHPITYTSWVRFAMEALIIGMYGFGRCNETLTTVAETPESMPAAPEMKKFIEMAEYLNDNNMMADAIWILNKNITHQLKQGGSFIMNGFELTNDQLWINMSLLIGIMIGIRLIAYYVLLWKANRSV